MIGIKRHLVLLTGVLLVCSLAGGTAGAHTWGPVSGSISVGSPLIGCGNAPSCAVFQLNNTGECKPEFRPAGVNGVDSSIEVLPAGVGGHKASFSWTVGRVLPGIGEGGLRVDYLTGAPGDCTLVQSSTVYPQATGSVILTLPAGTHWIVVTAQGRAEVTWQLKGIVH